MQHLFWAIECKTRGCKAQILLKYLGVYVPKDIPVLGSMQPNPIFVSCESCGKTHVYDDTDVLSLISDELPPRDFVDQF